MKEFTRSAFLTLSRMPPILMLVLILGLAVGLSLYVEAIIASARVQYTPPADPTQAAIERAVLHLKEIGAI